LQVLYIKEPLLKEMILTAESTTEECCGFLFGYETPEDRTLTTAMVAKNVTQGDRHRNFEIGPKDYLKAEDFAAQYNLNLLGIYHSHPNHPAIPSTFDRLAAQPYFSYVILSVIDKRFSTIRSWRLNDDLQFAEEKSVIT
jgi:proteasome lid subunit RPN8/RPN11